ncbi:MAG: NAD(P)-dependent oxidoreductase, partial [Oscillospiraceae bacterium]|nr:NAD(P)-dependent oxidoreductase [Oscillospiraceae bacterium]
YGSGMKKNFIYDMMTLVPSMLSGAKYEELSAVSPLVKEGYVLGERGFYKLAAAGEELEKLRAFFEKSDFNSLSFTDSRAVYQFYSLYNLWRDINRALENEIRLINLACEPLSAAELYAHVRRGEFKNELASKPIKYDLRSLYSELYGGGGGYMYSKEYALGDIKKGVLSGAFLEKKPPLG